MLLERALDSESKSGHPFVDRILISFVFVCTTSTDNPQALDQLGRMLTGQWAGCLPSPLHGLISPPYSCVGPAKLPSRQSSDDRLPRTSIPAWSSILPNEVVPRRGRMVHAWHPPCVQVYGSRQYVQELPQDGPMLHPSWPVCQGIFDYLEVPRRRGGDAQCFFPLCCVSGT